MYVCSFTGHRRIKAEHKKILSDILFRAIDFAYQSGCRKFLTGGAVGFDTEAAREVIKYRAEHNDISLVMYLPCVDQDAKWTDEQKEIYRCTISEADEVIYISELYTDGCIKERNLKLASECDMLIAYVARSNSGSAQTVRMAEARGKKVYNLYPTLEKGEIQ